MTPTADKLVFDSRIDQIGFADELKKHFADPLREGVKYTMAEKEVIVAEGEFFDARVSESSSREVDPSALLRMYENKTISRQQLVSVLSVSVGPCGQFMSKDEIAKISVSKPNTPRLNVTRKKGYEPKLADAVKAVGEAIAKK